jgi:hypothetical protein
MSYEMLRFPHFLDNRLIDGGKVVSLTPFTPKNIPGTFLLEAESTPGHSAAGRIRLIEKVQ